MIQIHGKYLKYSLLAIALLGLGVLVFPRSNQAVHQAVFGESVRIKISRINVDTKIEQVQLATDGAMDVPKNPADTGWYSLGPRPGEVGSAVIDGHVDDQTGAKAVFYNLHNLKPGDKVVVQDEAGVQISFVVRTSRIYGANANASDVFSSNDRKAHLNLITCDGTWDKAAHGYSQRLVVFTDKE